MRRHVVRAAKCSGDHMRELQPESIAKPFARYAHGVEVPPKARMIFTSGQLGMTLDGQVPEDEREQAEICFSNIEAILGSAGATRDDVVRINAYVTDRAYMAGYMRARDDWLEDVTRLPASTLVIVAGFTRAEFKVEIEVTAAVLES